MAPALPALASGTSVLVDANIFIYAFLAESEQCSQLIERCRREEVLGVTTAEVISDVCHRLMLREAIDLGLINRPSAVQLKSKQQRIKELSRYWKLTAEIFERNLLIIPLDEARQYAAQRIRENYGLLTNDSLIAAAALSYGISCLASRDADFDRIAELTVYKPSDIP
jgi:predicted nucleic acid-binding protein